jgi:hypothetical protein
MSDKRLTVCIVHDYAKFTLFGLVDFNELDDVWVLESLQKSSLLHDLLFLLIRHFADVDLLHNTEELVRSAPD